MGARCFPPPRHHSSRFIQASQMETQPSAEWYGGKVAINNGFHSTLVVSRETLHCPWAVYLEWRAEAGRGVEVTVLRQRGRQRQSCGQ